MIEPRQSYCHKHRVQFFWPTLYSRERPKFGFGFGFGAECHSKCTFGPPSASAEAEIIAFGRSLLASMRPG